MNTLGGSTPAERIAYALRRVRCATRLAVLNAPSFLVDDAWKGADRALEALGPGGVEHVSRALPHYMLRMAGKEQAEMAWERRCEGCLHWRGTRGEVELGGEPAGAWCTKIAYDDRSTPDPCPEFHAWDPS